MGDELEKAAEGFGYTDVSHVMEVFGVCPECS
jgi:Fe2+ or Zn2+ uptake regulation protein